MPRGVSGVAGGVTALQFTDYLNARTAVHELLHPVAVGHSTSPGDTVNDGPAGGAQWDPGHPYTQLFLSSSWVE